MISKQNAIRWANELRSGKYKQTDGTLQNEQNEFCCLGVGCTLFAPKYEKYDNVLIGKVPERRLGAPKWYADVTDDFNRRTGEQLYDLNDNGCYIDGVSISKFSFDEIADMLEMVYVFGRGSFPYRNLL